MSENYISDTSKVGNNVSIGKFVVIEDDVTIGDNCMIGHNVVIHKGSKIGANVRIDDNSVVGKEPMRSVNSIFKDEKKFDPALIKDGCLIGAGVIVYCGCVIGENTLIADLATVRENVTIGSKTIIGRGAAIENFSKIGSNCKIETNVYITAYSEVEDNVFIAPGVVTSNDNFAARSKERYKHFKGVTVKKGGRIGAQATILPGKIINEDGFVAAGSVVTKDVEKEIIVAGNPAKQFRKVPEDQLLKNQQ
ncbi:MULTISPECIES: acyltransferase [Clostridium]|uniref:Predicted UDP-3-O-[3-hydroxymyristoyl] glucosamine N-acyltransferase n=4 Tax=Clostridium TaxID=1485 RepID=D8GRT5_CLOLD|nr:MULTISPECIES: N-acetyltransferase [Clostridium]ADK16453.1 predicted UDP-3-O-[3-hydroxymyristoyl] glucosamine N-acyltransferase [Clostridium ljungdahlii DSM 13528]AGY75531.1 N-acetyltransferase [Clostridium autoethanogenum DSM 10061]ALU35697.1 Transferase hexapeptide repeat-containing protein [Clostridium autoethanogenum DSM 10061]OAA89671.1 dTDP-3-amino-3,6-dideoxy-alpha-D-galactopyranose 3-N-acetyltransferase [Clostridium ljungdahlii DSM 13528]OAA94564.1 dTDP-3-amino-3,6-dideoxy-alpha-D-ga